jgi:hypothetical protein
MVKNKTDKLDTVDESDNDPLLPEVYDYLNKFDFPLAQLLQRKFKIGFSRAERILKQLETKNLKGKIVKLDHDQTKKHSF